MSDTTALAERMRTYEDAARTVLPRRTFTLIRVDGRAFSGLLRNAERPFDDAVVTAMDAAAAALCTEISGAAIAYTQSDEVSILVTDFAKTQTQPWFGGVAQKIASVAASIASTAFNRSYSVDLNDATAVFDGRAFTICDPVEVANYFVWRQRDAVRNSISMAAQAHFSARRLHGLHTGQMQELLWAESGISWNAYPAGAKRGRVCTRHTANENITYTDKRTRQPVTTRAVRSRWVTEPAPTFTAEAGSWLADHIPALPTLT